MQSASTVFLVRPVRFSFNAETAASNYFQQNLADLTPEAVQTKAFAEFDAAVDTLRSKGVQVLVFEDTPTPAKPDAVFPNNWLTLHPDGRVLLYPMCAVNRRAERRPDILQELGRQFVITEVVDLSLHEQAGRFLEGTGSILFDHVHRIAYACLSPRTDADLFAEVAATLGYRPVAFHANDEQGHAIYHTNVMLCIGARVAVVCLASITDPQERAAVVDSLTDTGHEIVDITQAQVAHFAGNMLTMRTATTELIVLSQQAFDALSPAQKQTLGGYGELVPLAIPTIETIGGGSARCMLAEVFLPRR
ncbi:citrulline utilization hydrolase CtlX [Hymenobacter sp. GOD-10R]|uniref:citrulline utilization hydrolase CtlX n=1 Tax=Hymenobacter sp. GOD-10R TaxID=3093922 RepID=UPI002D794047|nr:arginine deiminase-related protein [Hymenobacter sp. GOD-10R]WRQ26964.1 arginine deiminase-related protein [Hymenobacter sp. GOD-10R]